MKRVVLVLPFTVLLFFYACMPTTLSPQIHTAVAQSQIAMLWTPTLTATVYPDRSEILRLLNDGLPVDDLEMAIDARYSFVDAWFPIHSDNLSRIFRIEIRCECVVDHQCCTPQRMFVVAMRAMKNHAEEIIGRVPHNVIRLDVGCHNSSIPTVVMSASWAEVKEYVRGNLDGYILGWHVTPNPLP